jgi:hypothetical protein
VARGGYRVGAGRPPGSVNKRKRSGKCGPDPLRYLQQVMRDMDADPLRRDRAAIALLPFLHARVADRAVSKKELAQRDGEAAPPPGSGWAALLDGKQ